MTAQQLVDFTRQLLGETVAAESRWTDLQLLLYANEGRREFCKDSHALRNLYTKLSAVSATGYRYPLDPVIIHVFGVTFDDLPLDDKSQNWYEMLGGQRPSTYGTPSIYRIIGNALDLFYNPDSVATIEVDAAIISTDLVITGTDIQMIDDQNFAAIDYAAGKALADDGRADEAEIHFGNYARKVKQWRGITKPKGARYVHHENSGECLD
jgi:hypothetical protein